MLPLSFIFTPAGYSLSGLIGIVILPFIIGGYYAIAD